MLLFWDSSQSSGEIEIKKAGRVRDQTARVFKRPDVPPFPRSWIVPTISHFQVSLAETQLTHSLTMCFHTTLLCGFCLSQVGRHVEQTCHPQMQQAPGHRVYDRSPSCIYPPTPYSCPNVDCIASTCLHNALRNQQPATTHQGRASLNYVPFHEVKAQCNDIGEACHLAAFDDYPPAPRHARSARVGPEWLKYKEWRKVIEMRARGKNILEIAAAVHKNASLLRVYVDTYLSTSTHHLLGPLPSASSTDSQSTADTSTGSDELFPLYDEVLVPVSEAPDPSFLSRSEQELVWKMFQRNETVRSMSEQLKKGRRKISQYINAYMRPRLLQLQEEEREAEYRLAGTSTYVTPLTNHKPHTPETARTAAAGVTLAGNPPGLRREQSLHGIGDTELELVGPLPINPKLINVPNQSPEDTGGSNALPTPKSATANSLFGDSPVGSTERSTGIVSTRQKEETAQPTSKKRKPDGDDVAAEPAAAHKRARHLSLP